MAEALGTRTPNYQRIEYGGQNVTLETLAKIARALNVQVGDFFAPTERTTPRTKARRPRKQASAR